MSSSGDGTRRRSGRSASSTRSSAARSRSSDDGERSVPQLEMLAARDAESTDRLRRLGAPARRVGVAVADLLDAAGAVGEEHDVDAGAAAGETRHQAAAAEHLVVVVRSEHHGDERRHLRSTRRGLPPHVHGASGGSSLRAQRRQCSSRIRRISNAIRALSVNRCTLLSGLWFHTTPTSATRRRRRRANHSSSTS